MIDHSEIRMVQKTLGQPYDDETVQELYLDYDEEDDDDPDNWAREEQQSLF